MRAAQYQDQHPGTVICCVDRVWHAWIPAAGAAGAEAHGRTEDELIDKLEELEEPRG